MPAIFKMEGQRDMNREEKSSNKSRANNAGKGSKKTGKAKANAGKKVRLQEYLDSLIELHKLQHVLLNQMDKEI